MPPSVEKNLEVTLRYFAWVRERTGRSEERVSLPASLVTVSDVIAWLRTRGEEYEAAFRKPDAIRVAIDRTHVKAEAPVAGAREIGFFPPVTGG